MSNYQILALRQQLGLSQADFARAVGVDVRTVARWESSEGTVPTGAAADVLTALQQTLKKHPDRAHDVASFVVNAVAVGGLAFLVISLFDSFLEGPTHEPQAL